MGKYIELIGQLKPKNNGNFPIADVNDLKGGYVQLDNMTELMSLLDTDKLKEGMLAYVAATNTISQYLQKDWNPWKGGGGEGDGSGVIRVALLTDLNDPNLRMEGQIVYVKEVKSLRYFDGQFWKSFNKIYIQPTPPEDKGGIWIDTSDEKTYTDSNKTIQNMVQVISVLQKKVNELEWALGNQIDFGGFENNHFNEYDDHENPTEPEYGTNVDEDAEELAERLSRDTMEIEPEDFNRKLPNGTHLCIKGGSYSDMIENQRDFLPRELLWVEDRQELWIKDSKTYKLIKIGSTTGGGGDPSIPDVDPGTMKQIITEIIGTEEKIIGINFGDMKNKNYDYQLRVEDGEITLHDLSLDKQNLYASNQKLIADGYYETPYFPIPTTNSGSPMLYINSIYSGGDATAKDYNPSSHNFVELVNLIETEINLNGLYLHYTEKDTGTWVTLPLYGKIPAGRTFLIRGSQSSVIDVNTTYLNVDTFDMEWTKEATLNNEILDTDVTTIWGEDGKIQFAHNCSLYLSRIEIGESYKDNPLQTKAPWRGDISGNRKGVIKWYIDLIGIGSYGDSPMPNEAAAYPVVGKDILYHRYFNMDPVNQAIKPVATRKNTAQWTHIDMGNLNPRMDIKDYTPKASFQHKNIFFNKNLLETGAPNIVTCSFGQNAHKTRCFNWVSKGYYDEYIWFAESSGNYIEGENIYESFKESNRAERLEKGRFWEDSIYDRFRSVSTDGTSFTVHKFIHDFPEVSYEEKEKTYFYKVGRDGAWTEEKSFTLRNRDYVIETGFNFLHISDQQGFVEEEYETWRLTAEFIDNDRKNGTDDLKRRDYQFVINTGDFTQNGNRINEWLDYFNFGDVIFKDLEQMGTVGNNDLAPEVLGTLGRGSDVDKMNPINVEFFFTSEHPDGIPRSHNGTYIPSVYSFVYGDTYFLSINSEITNKTREYILEEISVANVYTGAVKDWLIAHVAKNADLDTKIKWKIAYMHEMPFTIITPDLIRAYTPQEVDGSFSIKIDEERGGSHLNTIGDYWYATFLEDNGINLALGGHKHTFSNSRYIRDNVRAADRTEWRTMTPTVYDPEYDEVSGVYPTWYTELPNREKLLVNLSSDNSKHYVRYVMSQASGYKLQSNKEMPAQNIPWLMEYYPITKQDWNSAANKYDGTTNPGQLYPHYIVWNIGKGKETEKDENGLLTERDRIKGMSYKLARKDNLLDNWSYRYNVPYEHTDLTKQGGNGANNPTDNIIIEKIQDEN